MTRKGSILLGPPTPAKSGSQAGLPTTPGSSVSQTLGVPTPFAVFQTYGSTATCPGHQAAGAICYDIGGAIDIVGLGHVSEHYSLVEEPTKASCTTLHSVVRRDVAGKGTIDFAVRSQDCLEPLKVVCERTLDYVVTGGSGAYKHVTGRGTLGYSGCQGGSDTWTGTLSALPSAHEWFAPAEIGDRPVRHFREAWVGNQLSIDDQQRLRTLAHDAGHWAAGQPGDETARRMASWLRDEEAGRVLIRTLLGLITGLDREISALEDEISAHLATMQDAWGVTADGVPSPDPSPDPAVLPTGERIAQVPDTADKATLITSRKPGPAAIPTSETLAVSQLDSSPQESRT